jgi:hypothetical protein
LTRCGARSTLEEIRKGADVILIVHVFGIEIAAGGDAEIVALAAEVLRRCDLAAAFSAPGLNRPSGSSGSSTSFTTTGILGTSAPP